MRKLLTVLACASLVVGIGAPAWGNDAPKSDAQTITPMGKGGGHHGGHHDGDRHGGRGDHGGRGGYHRDGYRHGGRYDRGYYGHRYRYGYNRGYYGCGYYPDCDPYYGGGYNGGRRYYNDRYNDCGYRGDRYDSRCDCYHRNTRCDQDNGYRGGNRGGCQSGCYGPNSVDGQQENTSPVPDAPAAESP